ncbi:MAG: type II toxin-antitoxin system RelE/ParE family toxin [bacterium]|nr:type II toxin-antitoxin system RelE/ParE family toxin [bacterium]
MIRSVLIHPSAEAEINEAADFYDIESAGLGDVFLDEVEHAIRGIREFPDAAPPLVGRVRKRVLAKFPYSLLYSITDDEIRVLAVAHHKRRPFYWRGRR